MNQNDTLELIDKYIEQSLTEAEGQALRQWLFESDDHMQLFGEYTQLHLKIRQQLTAEDHSNSLQQVLEASGAFPGLEPDEQLTGPFPLQDLPELPPREQPLATTPPPADQDNDEDKLVAKFGGLHVYRKTTEVEPRRWSRWGVAAAVGLAVFVGWWIAQPTPVATLVQQNNLVWDGIESPPALGEQLVTGRYGLAEGFAELRFNDGTSVVLEAPVEFKLTGDSAMTLYEGKLAATVAQETDRFTVSTPSTHVIDFGTEFGVGVRRDGATHVAVFDGVVKMSETVDPDKANTQLLTINAHQQAGVKSEGILPKQPEALDLAHPFTRTFEETFHQLRVKGDVRWYRIPPEAVDHSLIFEDHFIVLRERTNTIGDRVLKKHITTPGTYTGPDVHRDNPQGLDPNGTYDSYLIHCNRGTPNQRGSDRFLSGRITFPRPIVAVLVDSPDLDVTDGQFGCLDTAYPPHNDMYRSLETGADLVELSDDRRTLRIETVASVMDQIRVLVESH